MAYLTINGITLPIALGTPDEAPRLVGEMDPAFDGELRLSRQATKQDLQLVTTPLALATAWAWQCLLEGRGEVWHWDSTHYGSKGTGPNSTTGLSIDGANSVWGGASLAIAAAGTPNTAVYARNLGALWTLAAGRKVGAAAWQHLVVTSDGRQWVDGVEESPPVTPTGFTVGATIQLEGDTVSQVNYDELIALPFVVPDTWPALLFAATGPFSDLPRLAAAGDGLAAARTVMGAVTSSKMVAKAGARYRVLAVELKEV